MAKLPVKEDEFMAETFKTYMEAINTHDFSQVAKMLHEDAVFCYSGKMDTDIEQIKAYHEHFWSTIKNSKFWATDINVIHSDCKCHVYTYQYNYSGNIENEHVRDGGVEAEDISAEITKIEGSYVEGGGRSTGVFVLNDGTKKWELLHEYSCPFPHQR